MTRVRAKSLGVDAQGGKVRIGKEFDHEGPLASWMELVKADDPLPAPSAPEPPQVEQSEAAPVAETKARKRKGAE